MNTLNNLVHLQINGRNQLDKEIEDIQYTERATLKIDEDALHRNEMTKEVEGEKIDSKESLF